MTVIFLNGAGSAGKSTIAKSIQYLADEPYIHFSFDSFFNMMPGKYLVGGEYAKDGFDFINYETENKPAISVHTGEIGNKLTRALPYIASILADKKLNLIIDEIIFEDEILKLYIELLKDYNLYMIAVKCSLEVMEERELLRGDRAIGLSRDQFYKVHKGFRPYDLEVDTTNNSSFNCAKSILDFVNSRPK